MYVFPGQIVGFGRNTGPFVVCKSQFKGHYGHIILVNEYGKALDSTCMYFQQLTIFLMRLVSFGIIEVKST